MDRQDAKPNRPSLLADDTPRSSAPAPSASRILADMESRAPATPGVRKPRRRRKRGAGMWIALGVVGLVLAGGTAWWLTQATEPEMPGTALAMTAPVSELPTDALPASLPSPSAETDHARVLSSPPEGALTGTADAAPRASAPAKIVSPETDNPFAVIAKASAAPVPVKPAATKTTPSADPFAVVAKATPAAAPAQVAAAATGKDDNPFARASAPRAAAPVAAARPSPVAKPKPTAPPTPPASKGNETLKPAPKAAASAVPVPEKRTDPLSDIQRIIDESNEAASKQPDTGNAEKAATKPLQRKTTGTDAEAVDDLVQQLNKGNDTVVKPAEAVTGSSASELLKKN